MAAEPAGEEGALGAAVRAARAAGALIRRAFEDRRPLAVAAKGENDFVTEVDRAAERVILDLLRAATPGCALWAEESGAQAGAAGHELQWIVDPLDGTHNFIHGYPQVVVSIALARRGAVELGVIFDPMRDHLYHAERGHGAWRNGARLRSSGCNQLARAMVASNGPFRPGAGFDPAAQRLVRVLAAVAALRRSGSAALDLAQVAAGELDACFDADLNAWDVAAGALLVREAGGSVGDFDGRPEVLTRRQCLAAGSTALAAALQPLMHGPCAPGAGGAA